MRVINYDTRTILWIQNYRVCRYVILKYHHLCCEVEE